MPRFSLRKGASFCFIGLVRLYQWGIAPMLGVNCRFEPSCSRYAIEAIQRHGPWRGVQLALSRILRCQPWGGNGFDPVPDATASPSQSSDAACSHCSNASSPPTA
jgi:putative membrane protein insertion efficiency factor